KSDGQPFPIRTKSAFNIIHWASGYRTIRIGAPILLSQCHLSVFDSHTKYRCYPHPEERSGPSYMDSQCYSGNISNAHGCRKCRRLSLEVVNISLIIRIIVKAGYHLNAVGKTRDLNKAQTNSYI